MRILLVLVAGVAWAQGIDVPSIGVIVDSSGALRQVRGVAGNFLLGAPIVPDVLSAAPPGSAILGWDGDDAILYFPESRTFARWRDNVLDPLDWVVDGEVLSVRANEIAARRDGTVWIIHPDGTVTDRLADAAGPVLLLPEGALFATSDELILRRRDASELRFELTGAESITAMGPHYAAIRVADQTYALRVEQGREALYLLPRNAP